MKVIVIDSVHPILTRGVAALGYEVIEDQNSSKQEIMSKLAGVVGIIIRSRFSIDASFIKAAPDLEFIGRVGAGMENIDLEVAKANSVQCFRAAAGNRTAVGEHALAMILMMLTKLRIADAEVRSGQWNREANRGYEMDGKIVGIIGYGQMGSAFAAKLGSLGVQVLAYDIHKTGFSEKHVKESTMEFLYKYADIISLHVPQTEQTVGLVNEAFIDRFEKDIYIINTSRGKVVNTADLVKALKRGKVLGACLDVLEYESSSFENFFDSEMPEDFQYLIESDKTILSPHIAGWTYESRKKMALAILKQIEQYQLERG